MKTKIVQNSFSTGEISPLLNGRMNLSQYNNAVKKSLNNHIYLQGAISNRAGTVFIAQVKDVNAKPILKEFVFNNNDAFVIEVGAGYFRFFRPDGTQAETGGQIYEVSNNYAADDIETLKFTQSGDVLYIVHKNYPLKQLIRIADNNWQFSNFEFVVEPMDRVNTDKSVRLGLQYDIANSRALIKSQNFNFNANSVGKTFKIGYDILPTGTQLNETYASSPIPSVIFNPVFLKKGNVFGLLTQGKFTAEIVVLTSPDNIEPYVSYNTYDVESGENISLALNFSEDCFVKIIANNVTWSSGDKFSITTKVASQSLDIYCKITQYLSADSCVVSFSDYPEQCIKHPNGTTQFDAYFVDDWQQGIFNSGAGNYPVCCGFYKDRFVLALHSGALGEIWLSKTGGYDDFGVSPTLVDTDAIGITLSSRKIGIIYNMAVMDALIVFTSDCEISIRGSTPFTITQSIETNIGSLPVVPMVVNKRIVFIERCGRVRDISYDYNSDGYLGEELSLFAEHYFRGAPVIDQCYQQSPDSTLYFVKDGNILALTYLREQQFLAWNKNIYYGKVKAICACPYNNGDYVFAIIDGNIERLELRDNSFDITEKTIAQTTAFLDNATKLHSDEDLITNISIARFAAGTQITILSDGNVERHTKEADETTYVLKNPGYDVHYGIGYESVIETLPIGDNPDLFFNIGKIFDVWIDFYKSRGVKVGWDEDKLTEIKTLAARPDILHMPLLSDIYHTYIASDNSRNKGLIIKQTEPLPFMLRSIAKGLNLGSH